MWRSIYDRVEATVNQGPLPRSNHFKLLSPVSMHASVQKPSKETRHLQQLFLINANEIKQQSSDLSSATKLILESLNSSDPWHDLTHLELIEKFENHAESLVSDSLFTESFKDWSGLGEIRSFCTDKSWWKRRRLIQNRPYQGRRGLPRKCHENSFKSWPSTSMEIASIDLSQDDTSMETPGPRYPKTAKKGTSILRPRFSASHTPGTPTRQMDDESDALVESDRDSTDDELQLVQLPVDVSLRIKNEKKATQKRKVEGSVENVQKRSRNKNPESLQFGRGRPPLTTVIVHFPNFKYLMADPIIVKRTNNCISVSIS